MSASDEIDSTHILPIPKVDQPYGGTSQNPAFFWNSSLPEDDVVCDSNLVHRNATYIKKPYSCCPLAIGISYETACRMHNTTENVQYWQNCTAQVAKEQSWGPEVVRPVCRPFTEELRLAMEERNDTANAGTCSALGMRAVYKKPPGDMVPPSDMVAQCCDKLQINNTDSPAASRGYYCKVKDDQFAKWNECITAHQGYPVCSNETDSANNQTDSAKTNGAAASAIGPIFGSWTGGGGGILVAAAALAALV